MHGLVVAHTLLRRYLHGGGPNFTPRRLPTIYFVRQQGATWQPMPGTRGTLQLAKRLPCVQPQLDIQLTNQHLPHHHMPCHRTIIHVSVRSLPCQCTIPVMSSVRTVQSTNFCLFGKSDRMRYLTHTVFI
jgi:hypothetical protein